MSGPYGKAVTGSFGFDRSGLPAIEAVVRVARRLWPAKTARHLSSRANVTHRAAEFWLSSATGMNADALAELLRSDAGLAILEELMGSARPGWWPTFRSDATAAAIERRLDALRSDIEEARRGLSP